MALGERRGAKSCVIASLVFLFLFCSLRYSLVSWVVIRRLMFSWYSIELFFFIRHRFRRCIISSLSCT